MRLFVYLMVLFLFVGSGVFLYVEGVTGITCIDFICSSINRGNVGSLIIALICHSKAVLTDDDSLVQT